MLNTEIVEINGRKFRHTWSDAYMIERDGVEYSDAMDPVEFERTYTETCNPLEVIEPDPRMDETAL